MQLEQLSHRFVGAQGAVMDLMLMVRQARDGRRSLAGEDLQLLENALFGIAGELVAIPAELADAVAEANRMRATALRDLERCEHLLKVYESEAEQNGLIPAILSDRRARTAELIASAGNVVMIPDPRDRALTALSGGAS